MPQDLLTGRMPIGTSPWMYALPGRLEQRAEANLLGLPDPYAPAPPMADLGTMSAAPSMVPSPGVMQTPLNADVQEQKAPAEMPQSPQMPTGPAPSAGRKAGGYGSPSYPSNLMKQFEDAYAALKQAEQSKIDQLRGMASAKRGEETQIDLSPLMALSDTWWGGNLSKGYKPPKSREEAEKQAQAFELAAMEAQTGLSAKDLDLLKTKMQAQQHREGLFNQIRLKQMDLDAEKAIAGMRAGNKQATAEQFKAAGFVHRMINSDKTMRELESAGYDPTTVGAGVRRSTPNWMAGNLIRSEEDQILDQAQRDFINATLRRESGAAISDSEFANANTQYFPQAGDSDAVLQKKSANRQQIINNLLAEAGGAYERIPSATAPTETSATTRSGAPAVGTMMVNPKDGKTYQFSGGDHRNTKNWAPVDTAH